MDFKIAKKKKKKSFSPFSSIFSNAERALLVLTFPNISLTLVAVLINIKIAITSNTKEVSQKETWEFSDEISGED